MVAAAMKQPLDWQIATVKDVRQETARVKTFTLSLPNWTQHRAGQHYDVRLTAADGYQAQRSYSIASEPELEGEIELTVERIEDGEVSTYMHDVLVPGDQLELRGPIGGYFVWEAGFMPEPLVLIAGGSGIVPLMSMLRHRALARTKIAARLLYSSRTFEDIIYYQQLEQLPHARNGLDVLHTLTRSQPPGWAGQARRIDEPMLKDLVKPFGKSSQAFICGPTPFVEFAANTLVKLGIPASQIRTERFGPAGPVKGA